MNAIERVGAVLIVTVVVAGCATWTPEQRAAWEEQERRNRMACENRGPFVYLSGACIFRGGGT